MRTIGAVIFPGFELLDLFGPLEMFGLRADAFEVRLVAVSDEPVESGQGPRAAVDEVLGAREGYDLLLVPGGPGTRAEVDNARLTDGLAALAAGSEIVTSVCTGAALLARAGVLDGRQATTNKRAFDWVAAQGPKVDWQKRARWVEDGNLVTSSGVSAGIDMSLAVIGRLLGEAAAREVADSAEYTWNNEPDHDPFAIEEL